MPKEVLSVKDLKLSFQKEGKWSPVVKGISYSLNAGETLGIVGESGSGKSVSQLALLGLLPRSISRVDHGEAVFCAPEDTVDLLGSDVDLSAYRGKHIGMIFQEPMTSLNPVFTCGSQLIETLQKHLSISASEAHKRAIEWFAKVDLPSPEKIVTAYPHELSGGQRQRVMIAMAMCCEPALLIADEPTTALDVTVQKKVLELIAKLQEENNTAVIFISHDLSVVKNIAHKVLVMRRGAAVEFGAAEEVFMHPKASYTKGLIDCKPENTPKHLRLTTVEEVLAGKALVEERKDRKLRSKQVIYSVSDLNKSYVKKGGLLSRKNREVKAVQKVSFDIKKGETMGLVGESGCGKSSLSKVLSGLLAADSGELVFNGQDISNFSMNQWKSLRGKIQFIFQDPYSALNPRHSVKTTLMEVLNKHQSTLKKEEREKKCIQLMMDVGLDETSLYKFPHQFSGGQRQRVVIARALAADPEFVIADESVSALDVSVQAQVLNLLNDLKAKYGLTYLFISHDLAVVNYMSDRLLVMKEGEIVESGISEEIYAHPQHPYTQELLGSVYS